MTTESLIIRIFRHLYTNSVIAILGIGRMHVDDIIVEIQERRKKYFVAKLDNLHNIEQKAFIGFKEKCYFINL